MAYFFNLFGSQLSLKRANDRGTNAIYDTITTIIIQFRPKYAVIDFH